MFPTLLTPPLTGTFIPSVQPSQKLWTVDQFHALGDLGHFEGTRAMLIDGVILEEGPMNAPHGIALESTDAAVRAAFGSGWRYRIQMPLKLGQTTDPEPDVAVVRGSFRGTSSHPTTADLVIEISDTSLAFDLNEKLQLYAAAGILDYWVVDVNGRKLHVFRDPVSDAAAPRGFRYNAIQVLNDTDSITPLAGTTPIAVADLLP